jgi:hypothetical protein
LGIEAGHLFGEMLRLVAQPWVQFLSSGKPGPVAVGTSLAALVGAGAGYAHLDAGLIVVLVCLGFTAGGVLFTASEVALDFLGFFADTPAVNLGNDELPR